MAHVEYPYLAEKPRACNLGAKIADREISIEGLTRGADVAFY